MIEVRRCLRSDCEKRVPMRRDQKYCSLACGQRDRKRQNRRSPGAKPVKRPLYMPGDRVEFRSAWTDGFTWKPAVVVCLLQTGGQVRLSVGSEGVEIVRPLNRLRMVQRIEVAG